MMIVKATFTFFLVIANTASFVPRSITVRPARCSLFSATDASAITYPVKRIITDQDIVDLASFRNDLTNPEMMVENAGLKSAGVDNTESAIEGLKIGFLYIGVPLAVAEYFNSGQDLNHAIEIYCE